MVFDYNVFWRTAFRKTLKLTLLLVLVASTSQAYSELDISATGSKKSPDAEKNRSQYKNWEIAYAQTFGLKIEEDQVSGYRLKAQLEETSLDPVPDLSREVRLHHAMIGGSYFSFTPEKKFFAANLGAHVTGDGRADSEVLPVGSIMTSSQLDDYFVALYGAAFTYVYGDGLLLPVLGFSWKDGDDSRLVFLLPFVVRYLHKIDDRNSVDVFIKPQGLRSVMKNRDDFADASSQLRLRLKEFSSGARYQYKYGRDMTAYVEGGVLWKRELSLKDGSNKIYSKDLYCAPYVGFGLRFGFGGASQGEPSHEVLNEL